MSAPWLGQQEALYSGLRWHLDVPPHGYVEQFNPPGAIVFPGEARVNVSAATTEAQVQLEGHVGGWVTDVETAAGAAPKLYGFDFARATEVWDDASGLTKIMPQLQPALRSDPNEFLPGERAVMKDLVLSTLYSGGEICLSYHMFNPYSTQPSCDVPGGDISTYFNFDNSSGFCGGLASTDLTAQHASPAFAYVEARCHYLGDFLDELLANSHISPAANVYVRLFHEPNAEFFWWGQPPGTPASDPAFLNNYHRLWNFAVAEIRARIGSAANRNRVKFVFSINAENTRAALGSTLAAYLPASPNLDAQTFIANVDLLGLDYYQDSQLGGINTLDGQYTEVVARATALGLDHALTEVGIRTDFVGKLYGQYKTFNPWQPPSTRSFFAGSVRSVAITHQPRWVMLWANRIGNAVLSNYAPTTTTSGTPNHSGLYYGDAGPSGGSCIDVFTDPSAEIFTPLSPRLPLSIPTYLAGDSTGPPQPLMIPGGIDALQYVPGAVQRSACAVMQPLTLTQSGSDMRDAVDDFDAMLVGQVFETL